MDDTPLGRIVSIRAETDSERIKQFSKSELEIYNKWKQKKNEKMLKELSDSQKREMVNSFHTFIKQMFGKDGV